MAGIRDLIDAACELVPQSWTASVTVATLGPGRWSLDHALGIHVHGYPGLLISLGGGILLAALVVGSSFQPPVAEAESAGAAAPEAESADVPVTAEPSEVELPEVVEAPTVPDETVDPEQAKAEEPTVPESPAPPKASPKSRAKADAAVAVAAPLKDVNLDSLAAEADALVAKAKAARTSGEEGSETEPEPAEPAVVEIDAVVTESDTAAPRSTQTKPRSSKSRSTRGQGSRASRGAPRQ